MGINQQLDEVTKVQAWIMAARLPTLPAAIVPVLVGTTAAIRFGYFNLSAAIVTLVVTLLIQIGTNLTNDLYDFKKGSDTEERLGPTRVTQTGLLSIKEVTAGIWITFGLAFLASLYLIQIGGWPIFVIGVSGIISGILYTAGPWPLAYHGLGDLFVFIFFGLVAVMGTFYLHTGSINLFSFYISLPVGFLVTAIIVVNNLRDIKTDRKANKRTLAVRLGRQGTCFQFTLLIVGAYLVPLLLWINGMLATNLFWLPLLTLPLGGQLIKDVFQKSGTVLNLTLKNTGKLHLIFGVLFAISLL
ncbi:1,4-dihydroxy-2-naphthoate polyprenyltransferase [Natroniella sulfidigena]|uniref:1,4-dihydroxy-2-naphthoate polyprenyltransferase n=1 Tax=Natroniella sulfidigena TaxID=723921 RepID=UPI00200A04FE|nr:1,4-dihydroxy-2-naphthoate polyprenyltransferase [Natroniella sulfidigena]MCK8817885.1 1,4-dihydroxy-2-naphthoate polyprenyltransferase [Natroniella sulfidigena]